MKEHLYRKILIDKVIDNNDPAKTALRNIRAFVLQMMLSPESYKVEDICETLLRFVKEGGLKTSLLRSAKEKENI
jgi:hypothetical protein